MREELKYRTKMVGLKTIELLELLPNKIAAWAIGKQIVRSATSVGANYRAACRAKSVADYIHKLKIVEEECDETIFWLEILVESKLVSKSDLIEINNEANQLLAIFIATIKTLKSKHYKSYIVCRISYIVHPTS